MKKSIVILSIMINVFVVVGVVIAMNRGFVWSKSAEYTYEEYIEAANNIENKLVVKEPLLKKVEPVAIAYQGNPNNAWTQNDLDILNGDPRYPLKKEYLIFDSDNVMCTKISLNYAPELIGKSYLCVNRIDNKISIGSEYRSPQIYSNMFSAKGMFIQVMTFNIETGLDRSNDSEVMALKMIEKNGDITDEIQRILLERNE